MDENNGRATGVAAAASLPEMLHLAQREMRADVWDYIEGASSGEVTAQRNKWAFDRWEFRPRMFAGVSEWSTSGEFGALELSLPFFFSPWGGDAFVHPDGFPGVTEVASQAGVISIYPEAASSPLEAIGAHAGRSMYQVLLTRHEDEVVDSVERAKRAGYQYVVLSYLPAEASIESTGAVNYRSGVRQWGPWRERISEWQLDQRQFLSGNVGTDAGDTAKPRQESWTWERLAALVPRLSLPWILKGTMWPDEVRRALDRGAAALYLSNYGGRHLDGVPATLDLLPEVAREAGTGVPILFEGGVRRGTDVVKALALGATTVGVGRLAAFALAGGGKRGVARMLQLLRGEIRVVMAELGVATLAELGPEHLSEVRYPGYPPVVGRNSELIGLSGRRS